MDLSNQQQTNNITLASRPILVASVPSDLAHPNSSENCEPVFNSSSTSSSSNSGILRNTSKSSSNSSTSILRNTNAHVRQRNQSVMRKLGRIVNRSPKLSPFSDFQVSLANISSLPRSFRRKWMQSVNNRRASNTSFPATDFSLCSAAWLTFVASHQRAQEIRRSTGDTLLPSLITFWKRLDMSKEPRLLQVIDRDDNPHDAFQKVCTFCADLPSRLALNNNTRSSATPQQLLSNPSDPPSDDTSCDSLSELSTRLSSQLPPTGDIILREVDDISLSDPVVAANNNLAISQQDQPSYASVTTTSSAASEPSSSAREDSLFAQDLLAKYRSHRRIRDLIDLVSHMNSKRVANGLTVFPLCQVWDELSAQSVERLWESNCPISAFMPKDFVFRKMNHSLDCRSLISPSGRPQTLHSAESATPLLLNFRGRSIPASLVSGYGATFWIQLTPHGTTYFDHLCFNMSEIHQELLTYCDLEQRRGNVASRSHSVSVLVKFLRTRWHEQVTQAHSLISNTWSPDIGHELFGRLLDMLYNRLQDVVTAFFIWHRALPPSINRWAATLAEDWVFPDNFRDIPLPTWLFTAVTVGNETKLRIERQTASRQSKTRQDTDRSSSDNLSPRQARTRDVDSLPHPTDRSRSHHRHVTSTSSNQLSVSVTNHPGNSATPSPSQAAQISSGAHSRMVEASEYPSATNLLDLHDQIKHLQTALATSQESNAGLMSLVDEQNGTQQSQLADLQDSISSKDITIASLQAELDASHLAFTATQSAAKTNNEKFLTASGQLTEARSQLAAHKSEIRTLTNEFATFKAAVLPAFKRVFLSGLYRDLPSIVDFPDVPICSQLSSWCTSELDNFSPETTNSNAFSLLPSNNSALDSIPPSSPSLPAPSTPAGLSATSRPDPRRDEDKAPSRAQQAASSTCRPQPSLQHRRDQDDDDSDGHPPSRPATLAPSSSSTSRTTTREILRRDHTPRTTSSTSQNTTNHAALVSFSPSLRLPDHIFSSFTPNSLLQQATSHRQRRRPSDIPVDSAAESDSAMACVESDSTVVYTDDDSAFLKVENHLSSFYHTSYEIMDMAFLSSSLTHRRNFLLQTVNSETSMMMADFVKNPDDSVHAPTSPISPTKRDYQAFRFDGRSDVFFAPIFHPTAKNFEQYANAAARPTKLLRVDDFTVPVIKELGPGDDIDLCSTCSGDRLMATVPEFSFTVLGEHVRPSVTCGSKSTYFYRKCVCFNASYNGTDCTPVKLLIRSSSSPSIGSYSLSSASNIVRAPSSDLSALTIRNLPDNTAGLMSVLLTNYRNDVINFSFELQSKPSASRVLTRQQIARLETWPTVRVPESFRELRRFIDTSVIFQSYAPNYTTFVIPLEKLLERPFWHWDNHCTFAFCAIKYGVLFGMALLGFSLSDSHSTSQNVTSTTEPASFSANSSTIDSADILASTLFEHASLGPADISLLSLALDSSHLAPSSYEHNSSVIDLGIRRNTSNTSLFGDTDAMMVTDVSDNDENSDTGTVQRPRDSNVGFRAHQRGNSFRQDYLPPRVSRSSRPSLAATLQQHGASEAQSHRIASDIFENHLATLGQQPAQPRAVSYHHTRHISPFEPQFSGFDIDTAVDRAVGACQEDGFDSHRTMQFLVSKAPADAYQELDSWIRGSRIFANLWEFVEAFKDRFRPVLSKSALDSDFRATHPRKNQTPDDFVNLLFRKNRRIEGVITNETKTDEERRLFKGVMDQVRRAFEADTQFSLWFSSQHVTNRATLIAALRRYYEVTTPKVLSTVGFTPSTTNPIMTVDNNLAQSPRPNWPPRSHYNQSSGYPTSNPTSPRRPFVQSSRPTTPTRHDSRSPSQLHAGSTPGRSFSDRRDFSDNQDTFEAKFRKVAAQYGINLLRQPDDAIEAKMHELFKKFGFSPKRPAVALPPPAPQGN